jgi:hypothetical protein
VPSPAEPPAARPRDRRERGAPAVDKARPPARTGAAERRAGEDEAQGASKRSNSGPARSVQLPIELEDNPYTN